MTIPENELESLTKATASDSTYLMLKEFIHKGWTEVNSKLLSTNLKFLYDMPHEHYEKNGLIFYNARFVIPTDLRKHMIEKNHSLAHLGITRTVSRIIALMYWPRMFMEVTDYINKCSTCQKFQNSNIKEPFINSDVPACPFQSIAMDIGEYKNNVFLIVEDYYSRWLDIPLRNKTNQEIIKHHEIRLSNFGIAETRKVRCDDNPFHLK